MTKAEQYTYTFEKIKYQGVYGWTDEQFDTFWNNPEENAYAERKAEMLKFAENLMKELDK